MTIVLFGESCTGKSAVAGFLKKKSKAEVYSGKDDMRLAKARHKQSAFLPSGLRARMG